MTTGIRPLFAFCDGTQNGGGTEEGCCVATVLGGLNLKEISVEEEEGGPDNGHSKAICVSQRIEWVLHSEAHEQTDKLVQGWV